MNEENFNESGIVLSSRPLGYENKKVENKIGANLYEEYVDICAIQSERVIDLYEDHDQYEEISREKRKPPSKSRKRVVKRKARPRSSTRKAPSGAIRFIYNSTNWKLELS